MPVKPLAKLAVHLAESHERAGSYLALEQRIEKKTGVKIDRRKLQALIESRDAALSFEQINAMHEFLLDEHRIGFGALFESQAVLDALVAKQQVQFLLGSQPREELGKNPKERRTDLSRWDTLAMHELFVRINRISGSVRLDFEDVLFVSPREDADAGQWTDALEVEPWHKTLADKGPSVVCIGSQRACLATELMLARMFGVKPFQRPAAASADLPFYFIWHSDERARLPSAFSLGAEDIRRADAKLANDVKNGDAWALKINGQLYRLDRFVTKSRTFGILAAQRRSGGQVWAVLAGLSGPGTYAVAKLIDSAASLLPASAPGEHSSVAWMAFQADVETRDEPGDGRVVSKVQELAGPEFWHPTR